MGARLQAVVALAIALGLHVGAFALRPGTAGASGAGANGVDLISLQAAAPSVSAMVEAWDAPPQLPDNPLTPLPPQMDQAPIVPAAPELTAPLPKLAPLPPLVAQADNPPQADVSATPPPPSPKAKPKPRPQRNAEPAPAKPRKPQPPASDGIAAQAASGAGGGSVAGDTGQAQAAALSQGKIADLTAKWGASIRSRIERRKRYPAAADGASGTVTVRLTINRSGALVDLSIIGSSGHPALDEAAAKAVRAVGRFPAAPKDLTQDSYSFTLPMRFSR